MSEDDVRLILATREQITSCLAGQECNIAAASTQVTSLPNRLRDIRTALSRVRETISNVERLTPEMMQGFEQTREWWFDDDYLGADLSCILSAIGRAEEYAALPRTRGRGHEIEAWLDANNVVTQLTAAEAVLDELIESDAKTI